MSDRAALAAYFAEGLRWHLRQRHDRYRARHHRSEVRRYAALVRGLR